MIGKFIDQIIPEDKLPQTLTSYSPCFRKEKGAHGIEERGVYRIHQFEKQEMVVVCRPEESMDWYEKMWRWSVELFRSLDIPVRQLECCSGDLADLKVKSCDIEAWSPRQQKYFEVSPAPTWATPRPAASRCGSRGRTAPTCPTPSTTPWWPLPACSSPSWRTTSRPTAAEDPRRPAALYGRQGSADAQAVSRSPTY